MDYQKKKILIVSRSFYPMNSPRSLRTTELVKEFARQGHEVTLLTVKEEGHHTAFEKRYGMTIKDIGRPRFPKIRLNGRNRVTQFGKRVVRRVMGLFFEYPDIELMFRVDKALKGEAGYDLLISIAAPYPVHWGVARAMRKKNSIADIWIADCGDPYYGRQNDSFRVPYHFSFVEKWFCQKADYITVPFEGAIPAYFEEFHSKIKVIPQGMTFPDLPSVTKKASNVITFAYFGNISSYRHYAIPFFRKLNSVGQEFKFIVYTRRRDLYEENLSRDTLKKCSIRGYVDRQDLLAELRAVDFLVYFPYENETQKSLKLIDYNFLNKPILVYENDEFSDRAFNEFLEYNFEKKKDAEDIDNYKIENVCAQFLKLASKEQATSPSHREPLLQ